MKNFSLFFILIASIVAFSCSAEKQPDELLQANTWEATSYKLNGLELLNSSGYKNLTWNFNATTLTQNSDAGESVFNYNFNTTTMAFSYSGYSGVVDTVTETILKVSLTDAGNTLDAAFIAKVQ